MQTAKKGLTTPLGLSPTNAWMNYALEDRPLIDGNTIVPQTLEVYIKGVGYCPIIFGAFDSGNSGNKVAFVGVESHDIDGAVKSRPYLRTTRVPTSFKVRQRSRFSERVYWRVAEGKKESEEILLDEAPYFSIGSDDGEALAYGTTLQRLSNERYVPHFLASLVEGLITAGHRSESLDPRTRQPILIAGRTRSEEKHIALAYGVRDDEIEAKNGRQVPTKGLEKAIQNLARRWIVERINPDGTVDPWTLNIRFIYPVAQTLGSAFAYLNTLSGGAALDKKILRIFDGGQKDLQVFDVSLLDGINATGGTVGEGAVILTEGLRDAGKDVNLSLTPVQAQEALRKGTVIIAGDETPYETIFDASARKERVNSILANTITLIDEAAKAHLLYVGGVGALLQKDILALLQQKGRATDQYFIAPPDIAGNMNVIGLLAFCLYVLQQRKKLLDALPEAIAELEKRETSSSGSGPRLR